MFTGIEFKGSTYYSFPQLREYSDFFYGVTARQKERFDPAVYRRWCWRLGITDERLLFLDQVHSDRTIVVSFPETEPSSADGMIVLDSGLFPVIRTADCVPVVVMDPQTACLCAFHAGWRGTCKRIVEQGVAKFLELTRVRPSELIAILGPCIRCCCYSTGREVRVAFEQSEHEVEVILDGNKLDLVKANRLQLARLGVTKILDSGQCTVCNSQFYSYRRDKTSDRIWTVAGFRDSRGS